MASFSLRMVEGLEIPELLSPRNMVMTPWESSCSRATWRFTDHCGDIGMFNSRVEILVFGPKVVSDPLIWKVLGPDGRKGKNTYFHFYKSGCLLYCKEDLMDLVIQVLWQNWVRGLAFEAWKRQGFLFRLPFSGAKWCIWRLVRRRCIIYSLPALTS